jgi:hypothetical protein
MKELKRGVVCVDELPGTRVVKGRETGVQKGRGGGGRERPGVRAGRYAKVS